MIGLVSGDERTFYWRLTGRQNLEFFASLYHVPARSAKARISELLETLGVADYADNRFNTYSTGIRQKFAIARGLLTEPRVLFLDEPTRALDPIAADEVRRYIVDHIVGQLGATVLVATHTLTEAEALCDRVAIIRHGKLVAAGSMDELTASMALATTFELVVAGADDRLRPALSAVPDVQTVHTAAEGDRLRVSVAMRSRMADLNGVLQVVLDAGARVESCATRPPTLDDVYRAAHAAA
jgi:ABC-2 type transport system ATP-binding protein